MRKVMGILFAVVLLGVITPGAFAATGKHARQQHHHHRHHQKLHQS